MPQTHTTRTQVERENRMLLALQVSGCAAIAIIWAMEWWNGDLSPWDRWAYPALMVVQGGCAALLIWWPHRAEWARVTAVLALKGYLVMALNRALFATPFQPYQLVTTLFWLPLGYGTAFVFLNLRAALLSSATLYLATYGTILWNLSWGEPPPWPDYVRPMMSNLAIAQIVYVIVLLAISQLKASYTRSQATVEVMRQMAATDPLTGLLNRRAMADHLAANHALVLRGTQPMSVILLDADHFKQINDRKGHAAGDRVLMKLSTLLRTQLRTSDRLARWGGEEFLVLVPATGLDAACELAERIRRAVAAADWDAGLGVTISLGVAQCRSHDTVDSLMARVDRALYAAKSAGRDRVCPEEAGAPPAVLIPNALSG